jgi:hypothetical protein
MDQKDNDKKVGLREGTLKAFSCIYALSAKWPWEDDG